MQYAACDPTRYRQFGVKGEHASCQDNLHKALDQFGIRLGFTPQPWNLFTNFFINPNGTFTIKPPENQAGRQYRYQMRDGRLHRCVCLSAGSESDLRRKPDRY